MRNLITSLAAGLVMAALLCALYPSIVSGAPAKPYGPAPDSLTWNYPPDGALTLPGDGGSARLPRGLSDLDVWATNRRGRPVYRLRQRGRSCFTSAHSRYCRVRRHGRTLRSAYDGARYGIRAYWWYG